MRLSVITSAPRFRDSDPTYLPFSATPVLTYAGPPSSTSVARTRGDLAAELIDHPLGVTAEHSAQDEFWNVEPRLGRELVDDLRCAVPFGQPPAAFIALEALAAAIA